MELKQREIETSKDRKIEKKNRKFDESNIPKNESPGSRKTENRKIETFEIEISKIQSKYETLESEKSTKPEIETSQNWKIETSSNKKLEKSKK